jgi:hypothetical protein
MNTTIKQEKDNRKRIEYNVVGYVIDEDLAKTVKTKVKDLVTDICNNAGKDYFRQDLKVLITDYVTTYISDIQINETIDYFEEKIEQQKSK